ncbi:glycosyltransferase [Winogradskyella sp.]|uniref:glycosyltransferase n=1 Tax=Winogradskyella sp. TaxID=1883156 RepID=UPI0025FBAACF|nr:glycosyltransferase [Winogradskyella sp.]
MKLSILIPMYNAKNYIGNCIESLINQDISEDDYEIIIIDDGSMDNSVDIVNGYAKRHKNISLHKEPNAGAYTTRNKLLKLANGDYIYNLDADDYIVKNCLGALLGIAESKQLDIIGFNTVETSSLDKLDISKPIEPKEVEHSTGKEFIETHVHFRHEIWWYFIKRDFMLEHHMSFNKNEYNADVMFTLEVLLKANKVGYLPVSLHRYVQTTDSLMRSKNFDIICKRIEYIQMMIGNSSQLINELKKESNFDVLLKNMSYRRDVFTFFNILNMFRNPFSVKYVKAKVKIFKGIGAYPMKNFNNYKYTSLRYRILLSIVNNEKLIYTLISIKNLFSKSIK